MNTTHKKLQSAMEYLMTYGWAILIIAVVIGVLYALGIFNGSGFLGSFCTAQTGYFCANPILSTNSPTLNVTIGQDTRLEWPAWKIFAVRGTAFNASSPNITGSGAFYDGEKQIVTIPLNSILGNYIPIGTPLSGTLWAEYCNTPNCNTPNQVSEIGIFYTKAAKLGYVTTSVSTTSLSTTSTTSTSTTSTATTAPTTTITPSGIIYSVPITLTNSQSSNTPAPFQQMVNISESTYSQYLTYNGNFANFEYYTLSGNTVNVLPGWIESNNSGKLITWVKLPNGIPAKSSITIFLGFASKSSNLLSSSGTTGIGEAPQLPCGSTPTSSCSTYAEYDDGASVFNFYDNFIGTSDPKWIYQYSGTAVYDNSLTVSVPSGVAGDLYTPYSTSGKSILEFFGNQGGVGASFAESSAANTNNKQFLQQSYQLWWIWRSDTSTVVDLTSSSFNFVSGVYYVQSLYWNTPDLYGYVNYTQVAAAVDSTYTFSKYIGLGGCCGVSQTIQWLRTRAYPPNGVMPSTSFGILQGGSPSVTVSPSSVSVTSGTSFTLTADVSGGTSPYTYQWYNATSGTGIPITGATSSTYTATAGQTAGTFDYYVKVTDSESPPQTALSPNAVVAVSLTFTSSSTYTVPNNVYSIEVTAVAGGGGGGNYGCWVGGGGGGAGESTVYLTSNVISVTPGEVLNIVVGTGGIGGTSSNGWEPGTAGTATSISNGSNTLLSLNPGQGGGSGCEGSAGGYGWPSGQGAGLYGGGGSGTYGGYGGTSTLISGYGSGGAGGYVPTNNTADGINGENGKVILSDQ